MRARAQPRVVGHAHVVAGRLVHTQAQGVHGGVERGEFVAEELDEVGGGEGGGVEDGEARDVERFEVGVGGEGEVGVVADEGFEGFEGRVGGCDLGEEGGDCF